MSVPVHASAAPIQWGAEALWQQLEPLLPGLSVEVLARTGSTNSDLLDRARRATRPDELLPCLLVAERQTAGRGRQGKAWVTAPGTALMFSLLLPYAPADWSGLSLAVGLALAEALDPPGARPPGSAPRIGLKWPNDLLLADAACVGRKLGGILIETVPVAASTGAQRAVVIGIGLNLQPQPAADDTPRAWGYACLQEMLAADAAAAPAVLARVAPALLRALGDFASQGFAPLQAAYAARDLLAGLPVSTTLAQAPQGVADGVDAQGMLWLRVDGADGRSQRVSVGSGEVSVRRAGDAAGAGVGA